MCLKKLGLLYEADEMISTVSFELFRENDVTIYPDWSPSKREMFENKWFVKRSHPLGSIKTLMDGLWLERAIGFGSE